MTLSPHRHGPSAGRRRIMALSLALMAFTAGCVRQGSADVKITALDAELVFGVKKKDSAPTPPEAPSPPVDPSGLEPFGFRPNNFDLPLFNEPTVSACPSEFTKANPDRDADVVVTGDLAEGGYTFRGTFVREMNTGPVASPLPNEVRTVKNYKRVVNGAGEGVDLITYDYIQPFGAHFLKSSIQVKALRANGASVRPPTENIYEQTPRVRADPEAGVAIKRTELIDAKGNRVADAQNFDPESGLLLLPLPVESSDFTSTAVDRSTGRTVLNQAGVKARERINACGEPVDGWYVDAFIAVSQRDDPAARDQNNQYRWQMVVAPQYAGLIIGEIITRRFTDKPHESIIRNISSVDPIS